MSERYARERVFPRFRLHIVTAYAIARDHSMAIGKAESVSRIFANLQPGTVAAA